MWLIVKFLFVVILEKVIDGNFLFEDWVVNIEICDIINEMEEGWVYVKEN